MSTHSRTLPHLSDRLFMTDGGLETTLIFHDGMELPAFASFDLLKSQSGTQRLIDYYRLYIEMARDHGLGIVLEAPTWRANADWGAKLGYDARSLAQVNQRAIGMLDALRTEYESPGLPIVVSGCIGPRGDGYRADARMSVRQARDYHAAQIGTFAGTDADLVSAFTMNYVEEAQGIVLAARDAGVPVVISFTLETDGRLPTGESLQEAIEHTDGATDSYAAYYMINCAHPTHFAHVLNDSSRSEHPCESELTRQSEHPRHPHHPRHPGESRDPAVSNWLERILGVRANASRRSHAELDESTDLDDGDPFEMGEQYAQLKKSLPRLAVVGGCCGTDHRHVQEICGSLVGRMASPA